MGTPVFTSTPDDALISNNVVDIDALDNGIWTVAFSDANTVQVFDGRIPVQQIAAPAGTVKSVALIQSPGADSVGVAIGTTTNLKFVQPSVNLRAAMAHRYQEPIHVGETVVVDSAGVDGIFWTGTDAVQAGANAGRGNVLFSVGTYGSFDMFFAGMTATGSGKYKKNTSNNYGTIIDGGITDHAIDINAQLVTVQNFAVKTTKGGGSSYNGIRLNTSAEFFSVLDNYIIDSDFTGISMEGGAQFFGLVKGNVIQDADGDCIEVGGGYSRIIGNSCYGAVSGIDATNTSDGNTYVGNTVGNAHTIVLVSGANNNAVTGNATDIAISNSGSGNTVGDNSVF